MGPEAPRLGLLRHRRSAGRAQRGDPPVDVLLSHGPPLGFGDRLWNGEHAGDPALLERLEADPPAVCVCGHIHEAHGRWTHGPTEIANVSHVDISYEVRPRAWAVFEL